MQPSWLLVYRQTTYIILMITIAPPPKEPIIKDAETAPKGEVSSNWELWFSLLSKTVSQLGVASSRAGNATLVAGTVTVSAPSIKTTSVVILTRKATGGTPGAVITYTISSGVSFTINSDNVADTSTFSWFIIDP